MCSCSQKSNISNLPTASLCCAGSITYKCIGKIQNMKVIIYRPQFENVHFLWVNNASTSFFTHFYSINFIYTAYFAWNYFIFTSYMKYFCLWSITIVTAVSGPAEFSLVAQCFHVLNNDLNQICQIVLNRIQGPSLPPIHSGLVWGTNLHPPFFNTIFVTVTGQYLYVVFVRLILLYSYPSSLEISVLEEDEIKISIRMKLERISGSLSIWI